MEAASDLISSRFVMPIIFDKSVKLCDLCLYRSREIQPKAVGGDILDSIFAITVANDVISGVAVE